MDLGFTFYIGFILKSNNKNIVDIHANSSIHYPVYNSVPK